MILKQDGLEWKEDMPLDVKVTVTVGEKRGKFGGLKKFTVCFSAFTMSSNSSCLSLLFLMVMIVLHNYYNTSFNL